MKSLNTFFYLSSKVLSILSLRPILTITPTFVLETRKNENDAEHTARKAPLSIQRREGSQY